MRLGDTEWVEDIDKIIKKNQKREFKFLFIIGGYILFAILFSIKQYIFAFIFLFLGFIIPICMPKKIKLSVSDYLAVDLYNLFINIEKYDGKNPHFREEAKNHLTDLDINIDDYIRERKKLSLVDFSEQKNKEYLVRLQLNAKKICSFLDEFNKYKEKKDDILELVRKLAFAFHNNDAFPSEAYTLIAEFEKIDLPSKAIRFELKPFLKKYLIENRLVYNLLFIILFPIIVWNVPNFTSFPLSIENRLIIIIPVTAMFIIGIIANSQKHPEKKSSA